MKVMKVENHTQSPNFNARLACDNAARKVITQELTEMAAFYKQNHIKAPIPTYSALQQRFKEMTKGIGGTFKLIAKKSAPDSKFEQLDAFYKSPTGQIKMPDSKALLSPYEVMPSQFYDGEKQFTRAVRNILDKVFNPNMPHTKVPKVDKIFTEPKVLALAS